MFAVAVPPSLQRRARQVEGWLELGCAEIALERVEPLLDVAGARAAGLYLRARAWVALANYDAALRDIEALRPLHHDPDWLDLTEAWCCKRLERLPAAIACMERLIQRTPNCAIGHFNLGCYLALLGEPELAVQALHRACVLDATFRGDPLDDADLDSLRGRADFQLLRR